MNFLLIRPKISEKKDNIFSMGHLKEPPLGLLYIGAALENNGHKSEILDYFVEDIPNEKLEKLLLLSNAVGITINTDFLKNAANLSSLIRELSPEIPLIIGGPHCIFFPKKSLIDIPEANVSVIGEGEQTIIEIAEVIEGKKNFSEVHGIYYKQNNNIKAGKPIKIINNIDNISFPARHLVKKYNYIHNSFFYKFTKNITSMITSRGCPFQCRFCNQYGNFIKSWIFRKRSVENIINEFQEINGKYNSIIISDECFLADKYQANRIFDMILQHDINVELIIVGSRVDLADKDLYLKMKRAGVKFIYYGIESGNQDILDFYNKGITLQQIRKAMKLASEMNFFIEGSFILGAPIETKKHIENTIKFACSLPIDIASFSPLVYIKGSSLWNDAVKKNNISINDYYKIADSKYNLGNFTKKELIEWSNNAFKFFYFRPEYIFSQIYKSIERKNFNLFVNGLKIFIKNKYIRKENNY